MCLCSIAPFALGLPPKRVLRFFLRPYSSDAAARETAIPRRLPHQDFCTLPARTGSQRSHSILRLVHWVPGSKRLPRSRLRIPWRTWCLPPLAPQAELAHIVADAIVERHLATMLRLGVEYDVLPRESEILHLQFWASAFELLKQRQAIYLETEGKNAGCWVMPAAAFACESGAEDNKVIVRSDGTVTYVGKDIAYQLWKFGLLGKDFHYRPLMRYADGRELWVSTDEPDAGGAGAPSFGHGTRVYNVIDVR